MIEPAPGQAEHNAQTWSAGQFVENYDNLNLAPAEAVILARYREALTGRVLDLGCGAGRILGYLVLRGLLAPGGLLIFSSHNLDHWDATAPGRASRLKEIALAAARLSPAGWVRAARAFPAGRRNRRRLAALQHRGGDHAVVNDGAHNHALLHYYIGRVAQEGQLAEAGLTLIEVLEGDGVAVPDGEAGRSPWLYYVAHER